MGGRSAVWFLSGCSFAVLLFVTIVNGYHDGAPDTTDVCQKMLPGHSPHEPQVRPAPFTISLSSERYTPGQQEPVRVTIKMNEGTTFRGFIIQARRADSSESIGKFKNLPWTKQICLQNTTSRQPTHTNSLTHADSKQLRTEVTVEWIPPPSQSQPVNVQFRVTIVVDFSTYWVDERSSVLYDHRSKLPTTPRPYVADITEGCGRLKGCYRNPPSCTEETCDIVATWRESDDKKYVEFQLSADTDGWVAIGLSDDKKMGSDDVMECVWNKMENAVNARMSKNTEDKQNRLEPSSSDLQRLDWTRAKGRIRCQFIRVKRPGSTVFDSPKHVLLAKGPATDTGLKQRHSLETGKYPYVSPDKTTMSEKKNMADMTDTARYPLVKAHGCLMLIGWMMCASTALILAKYYKRMWPNKKLCGAPVWLAVHRGLMLTNLVCTCIAFILIFVHVRGYSKMPDYPDKAHPPLGICVAILVILNPIISLFRCKPDTVPPQQPPKCRPLFNWFHWLFGTVAYVLQMPTIFIGLNLHKAFVPSWATWVITAFVLFHLIVELLLEIHGCLNAKKQKRQDDEAKPDFKGERGKEEPVGYRFKKRILTLYVIVVTVLGIVMVIAVAAG